MESASEDDVDANIIPSSNIEPPPPVTYVMPIMKQLTKPLSVSSASTGRLTRHALSYTDSPSFAAEANLFSQADEFEDACSSNNSYRSKGQIFTLRRILEFRHSYQQPKAVCFIEFAAAFDSVYRESLWRIVALDGVPAKIIPMIKAHYRPTIVRVLVRNNLSQLFGIRSGVGQGSILSPSLSNYAMKWILGRALHEGAGVEFAPGHRLTDLDYADDIALQALSFNDLWSIVSRVNEAAKSPPPTVLLEPAVLLHRVSRTTDSTGSSSDLPMLPPEKSALSPSRTSSETPTLTYDVPVLADPHSVRSMGPVSPPTSKPESSSHFKRPALSAGDLVYGKWRTDNYFYAGQIVKVFSKNRIRVHFDDNSHGLLSANEIIGQPLLPVGANVAADLLGEGEYEAGYVIADSKASDSEDAAPFYSVRNVESKKLFTLQRARVAITEEEVVRLNAAGLLGHSPAPAVHNDDDDVDEDAAASSPPSSGLGPSVQNTCLRTPSNKPTPNLTTPEVSLENLVYGKRSTALRITKRPPASTPGTQRSRRIHTAPTPSDSTEPPFEEDDATTSTATDCRTLPKKRLESAETASVKRRKKALSSQRRMNKRDSQPLSAPIVKKAAGSTPIETKRQKLLDLSDRLETPSHPLGPAVMALSFDTATAQQRTLLVPDSEDSEFTQPMTDGSRLTGLPSVQSKRSRLTRTASRTPMGALTDLCRKYNIPPPAADLFASWAIVLTLGVSQSGPTDRNSLQLSTKPTEAACSDRDFLSRIITAGGGRLIESIEAGRLSCRGWLLEEDAADTGFVGCRTDSEVSARRVALVAPTHMRTLKYLQALGTLGRVPLLGPTWILDACRLMAGREPLATAEAATAALLAQHMPTKACDLPMHLLKLNHEAYELNRGLDRMSNQVIPASVVPALYLAAPDGPHLETLFTRSGLVGSVVAIVTDDARNFGQGWASILSLVNTYENSDGRRVMSPPPPILPSTRALDWLTMWKHTSHSNFDGSSSSGDVKQLVFLGAERFPAALLSEIRSLGFVLVNKEFFIHSLIHGRLLDFTSGLALS
nr:unnamed protein product [Spirometra erinaceieuropaei]